MKYSRRLFFDEENLLRCRARISSEETLNYGMRFSILLQRPSNVTKLITHIILIKFVKLWRLWS